MSLSTKQGFWGINNSINNQIEIQSYIEIKIWISLFCAGCMYVNMLLNPFLNAGWIINSGDEDVWFKCQWICCRLRIIMQEAESSLEYSTDIFTEKKSVGVFSLPGTVMHHLKKQPGWNCLHKTICLSTQNRTICYDKAMQMKRTLCWSALHVFLHIPLCSIYTHNTSVAIPTTHYSFKIQGCCLCLLII